MHMEVRGRLAGAYPVGPRNSGHRLGGKSLYPLSHLTGPKRGTFVHHQILLYFCKRSPTFQKWGTCYLRGILNYSSLWFRPHGTGLKKKKKKEIYAPFFLNLSSLK